MNTGVDRGAVAVAAGGALVVSTAWYTAFGRQLAELDEAYAEGGRPPAWVVPVELARSATVATAVAVLAQQSGIRRCAGAARLATGLWVAFPVVLLTGSVVHEKVPWKLAAIHGGDWFLKLALISAVVTRRSRPVHRAPHAGSPVRLPGGLRQLALVTQPYGPTRPLWRAASAGR